MSLFINIFKKTKPKHVKNDLYCIKNLNVHNEHLF